MRLLPATILPVSPRTVDLLLKTAHVMVGCTLVHLRAVSGQLESYRPEMCCSSHTCTGQMRRMRKLC